MPNFQEIGKCSFTTSVPELDKARKTPVHLIRLVSITWILKRDEDSTGNYRFISLERVVDLYKNGRITASEKSISAILSQMKEQNHFIISIALKKCQQLLLIKNFLANQE